MRHRNTGRQFGRNSSHRKALFRNLVTSLLEHGKVETTEAKAKEIRGIADKMITLGKRGDLHAKKTALSYIQSGDVVAKLFDTLAPRSAGRNGGYTRIIKTRVRYGDSAPMAVVELVDREGAAPAPKGGAKMEEPVQAAAAAAPEPAAAAEEKPKRTRKKAEPSETKAKPKARKPAAKKKEGA